MKMQVQLLYELLSERYRIEKCGRFNRDLEVGLPLFFSNDRPVREGDLIICRTQEVPQECQVSCLFLCLDGRPDIHGGLFSGSVLYFPEQFPDILSLFSEVNRLFQQIDDWEETMESLVQKNAPMKSYVLASIPLFRNGITITDYSLRILASTRKSTLRGAPAIVLDERFERIPEPITTQLKPAFLSNASVREPFFIKGQQENPEGMNYCINLYQGSNYLGSCALWEQLHPIRQSECLLFVAFSGYIQRALRRETETHGRNILTIKTIFSDLLQCFPVSSADLERTRGMLHQSLKLSQKAPGHWRCIVIESANHGKSLPVEYLCATLEDILPFSYAVPFQNQIACFCMVPEDSDPETGICQVIEPWLKDMNFHAGISDSFLDVLEAQKYYTEARVILQTGADLSPQERIYRFDDYVLPYMLDHCSGELSPEMVLGRLAGLSGNDKGADSLTILRLYLDNECNAAQTAQELYLHRSSLMPKLEKIKSVISLDTPEERLYVRLCLAIMRQNDRKKSKDGWMRRNSQ